SPKLILLDDYERNMIIVASLMFTQLLDCRLLLVLGLDVLPLGLYQGWDDDYGFYCNMTIRKSTDLEIVADVEINRGFNEAKCVNCYFVYGVWTETSERSHAEVHVASLLLLYKKMLIL
ncbi:hypothetical protein FOZ63_020882, partial [Perkinsus olseni]